MRPRLDLTDPKIVDLCAALFVPYSYGAGKPSDGVLSWPEGGKGINGGTGWDCGGYAQAALVRLGLLAQGASDRGANDLLRGSQRITEAIAKLGDLAFYGDAGKASHVMVCLGGGVVIGASGGTSVTNGNDPRAFVMLRPLRYRADMIGLGRLVK